MDPNGPAARCAAELLALDDDALLTALRSTQSLKDEDLEQFLPELDQNRYDDSVDADTTTLFSALAELLPYEYGHFLDASDGYYFLEVVDAYGYPIRGDWDRNTVLCRDMDQTGEEGLLFAARDCLGGWADLDAHLAEAEAKDRALATLQLRDAARAPLTVADQTLAVRALLMDPELPVEACETIREGCRSGEGIAAALATRDQAVIAQGRQGIIRDLTDLANTLARRDDLHDEQVVAILTFAAPSTPRDWIARLASREQPVSREQVAAILRGQPIPARTAT